MHHFIHAHNFVSQGLNLKKHGLPNETQLQSMYAKTQSQINHDTVAKWGGFYLTLLFFKNCVIIHGVKQRLKLGVASSANAKKVASLLPLVVSMMQNLWEERVAPTLNEIEMRSSRL